MPILSTRGLAALVALALPTAVLAETKMPTAVEILFDRPHLDKLDKGAEVKYQFERTVSDAKILGEPWTDEVKIAVEDVSDKGRKIAVSIFTGERARDVQHELDRSGNPVLVLFLDRAVNAFGSLANFNAMKPQPRLYFMAQFKAGLREKATVEPVAIEYAGKSVDGYKVTVMPYATTSKAAPPLQGYEGSRFSFVVSDAVPGTLVEMIADVKSTLAGTPAVTERLTVVGAKPERTTAQAGATP